MSQMQQLGSLLLLGGGRGAVYETGVFQEALPRWS